NIEALGDLCVAHPSKKPHLDDLCLLLVEGLESVKYIIEHEKRIGPLRSRYLYVIERKVDGFVATLGSCMQACVIDKYLPHQTRSYSIEMRAVLPLQTGLPAK